MPSASHSMLLNLHSAPIRLLLANAIGQRIVLSGAMCVWQVVLSLSCNSPGPRPIPDASYFEIKQFSIIIKFHAYFHLD